MKKIININLSGRLIPIEDSAYEMLKDYINSLRAYFANEEGCDEIISDIESRIAELFQEKIKAGVQCITDEDLNQIMDSIGRPEDLTEAEEPGAGIGSGSYSAYQEEKSVSGKGSRFFRNANDKIIGGVCSGIAHGLQIDPALVRILYVLLAFGSFGIGVLLYLVLWALLPAHAPEPVLKKRLFRSREDRVIAGVAGGLAAYFNIPAWIPRLIFIAPLLINAILAILGWPFFPLNLFPIFLFSSIMGTFFLTYLILLIILPVATTASEKLQMRGQKVDLENIKNTVKEELKSVKSRTIKMGAELKESARQMGKQGMEIAGELKEQAAPMATKVGYGIGRLIKFAFYSVLALIGLILFIGLISLFAVGLAAMPLKEYFLENEFQNGLFWMTLLFFVGVPIMALLLWIIRKIMKVKTGNRTLGYVFSLLWILGLASSITLIYQISRNFDIKVSVEDTKTLLQPENDKLVIRVENPKTKIYSGVTWIKPDGIQTLTDRMIIKNVRIDIDRSPDTLYHIRTVKYSRGNSGEQAEILAQNINYPIEQNDSTLTVGNGFAIMKGGKYRAQQIVVKVEVPVGKKIRIDKSLRGELRPNGGIYSLFNDGYYRSYGWNYDADYIMTSGGLMLAGGEMKNEVPAERGIKETVETQLRNLKNKIKELERKKDSLEDRYDLDDDDDDDRSRRSGRTINRIETALNFSPWISILRNLRQ